MIHVGDKLMFSSKALNDMYGHGEPVEVTGVGISPFDFKEQITVRVWQPFLYYGQEPHQFEMTFHSSHFLFEG